MSRIAILTPCFVTGDAVGNDVAGMYDALLRQRHRPRVFDANLSEGDRAPVMLWRVLPRQFKRMKLKKRLPRFERSSSGPLHVWPASRIAGFLKNPNDILIYHFAMGWDFSLEVLRETRYRRIVKWHNITPAHFFKEHSWEYEAVCEEGRQQVRSIANLDCDLYLSDSEYNAAELLDAGVSPQKSVVVPPFTHTEVLKSTDADLSCLDSYRDGATNLLIVGRIAPNKGHELLIDAFDIYHHQFNANSRLLIVGKDLEKLETYSAALRERVARRRLESAIVFTGEVSEAELKALYLLSDLLVLTSEHEGFCVPLIEAMSMKLAIVAGDSSAVPSTLGDAGILLKDRDPQSLAQTIDDLIKHEGKRFALGQAGARRYEQFFTNARVEERFLNAVGPLLNSGSQKH